MDSPSVVDLTERLPLSVDNDKSQFFLVHSHARRNFVAEDLNSVSQ